MIRRTHILSVLVLGTAIAGCSEQPLLTDRDGGTGDPDAPVLPDATANDAPPLLDAGPSCATREPIVPADPTAGDWTRRFANPGVGGDLPNVEAFAFGTDGTVYVGGQFTTAGYAPASNVAAWDGATGWRALGAGLSGRVRSLAVDPAGVLFAAYAPDDGWDPTRVARWDGAGWTTVADTAGPIEELAFDGARLYVLGSFTRIAGLDIPGVAFLDGTTWAGFPGLVPDDAVRAISSNGPNDVCIGGGFTTLGVLNARQAACWDGTEWTARSIPIEWYRGVFALQRDPADGSLVAGGDFMVDSLGTNGGSVARWVTDHWELVGGGVMSELGPGSTSEVRGLVFTPSGMFVGGAFRLVDPASPREAAAVARWNGTAWDDLGGLFAEVGLSIGTTNVYRVAAGPDGSVYFGGLFTRADSLRVAHVVRWDGTYWSALRTPGERYEGVGGSVLALARHAACSVYVGGEFEYAGGVRANNVARYVPGTGYEALGTGVLGAVMDLAVTRDDLVYASGEFVDADTGTEVRSIAVWNGAAWRGLGAGLDGRVWSVALDEPETPDEPTLVYAGGTMTASGSTPVTRFGVFDGSTWTDLGAGFTGYPYAWDPTMESDPFLYDVLVDPETGDVVVAGSFRALGTGTGRIDAANIARWDGTAWHAYGDGLGAIDGAVLAIAWLDGELVAGGSFEESGTAAIPHVARWNGTAWEALGTGTPGAYAYAALESVGGALFAGGAFEVGGSFSHIAVWDGTSWNDLSNGLSDIVEALVATDDGVYVGGTFDRAGSSPSVGLALFEFED